MRRSMLFFMVLAAAPWAAAATEDITYYRHYVVDGGPCAPEDSPMAKPGIRYGRAGLAPWCDPDPGSPAAECPVAGSFTTTECYPCDDVDVACPAASMDQWVCPGLREDGPVSVPAVHRALDPVPGRRYRVWSEACNTGGCSGASDNFVMVCVGDYWLCDAAGCCRQSDGWCPRQTSQ